MKTGENHWNSITSGLFDLENWTPENSKIHVFLFRAIDNRTYLQMNNNFAGIWRFDAISTSFKDVSVADVSLRQNGTEQKTFCTKHSPRFCFEERFGDKFMNVWWSIGKEGDTMVGLNIQFRMCSVDLVYNTI